MTAGTTTLYGHDLLFGTFVTPVNHPVHQAVEQAVVADRAGLDLVTFQDHPYVAKFHDTSTLLSYSAARTERIHLSTNVTNLPLRPPAVLARAIATLDLLSNGRVELGIGAGASWDGIAGMGGPPTQSRGVDRGAGGGDHHHPRRLGHRRPQRLVRAG